MRFKVESQMEYEVFSPSTFILNIHALKTHNQVISQETLSISPHFEHIELVSVQGENRYVRLDVRESGPLKINYTATVDNAFEFIDSTDLDSVPVGELDAQVLPYLYPSRYCQSDKLLRLANNKFGHIENAYRRVVALTDWIYRNVEYLSGSTNSQTSAYDTVTEQAGVCRDFAHLGIALCRALTIPARYFTGYAFQLNPPDFHACFEAYLGERWIVFDATKLTPLNGLVKIAGGRDAADTAIASIFGNVICGAISVNTSSDEKDFAPFFYNSDTSKGLNYL